MADKIDNADDDAATKEADAPDPVNPGFWVVKILAVAGLIGLGGLELFSDQSVSPFVYAALAAIAGGPEIAGFLRKP